MPSQRLLIQTLFLHFDIDTVTHEIMLSFLGKVQLEVICSLLEEKISCGRGYERAFGYLSGKTAKKASCTIHIEVPPNPFWASIGLTVTPLPVGSGTQYKKRGISRLFKPKFSKCRHGGGALWNGAGLIWLGSDRLPNLF